MSYGYMRSLFKMWISMLNCNSIFLSWMVKVTEGIITVLFHKYIRDIWFQLSCEMTGNSDNFWAIEEAKDRKCVYVVLIWG